MEQDAQDVVPVVNNVALAAHLQVSQSKLNFAAFVWFQPCRIMTVDLFLLFPSRGAVNQLQFIFNQHQEHKEVDCRTKKVFAFWQKQLCRMRQSRFAHFYRKYVCL